jgi:N-carbamoyl-L-amino-acid hydrolase
VKPRLSIDAGRLYSALAALGEIGRYEDPATGLAGVNRLALSAADGEGRRHVVARMRALGLLVTIDRIGNVMGKRPGTDPKLAPVLIGSHIDSVPTAGRFDGCLGVLGGLEVIETLNQAERSTRRAIVVAFFSDEEGCRFGTDMLGSAVACGRIPLESAYALRDASGRGFREELEAIGFLGTADVRLAPPHVYLECHIEQGPVLRAHGRDLGIPTGVQAISWHELTIVGRSAHAGTTPMALRSDAGVAASRINLELRGMTASGAFGPEMRATMGAIAPEPGLVNIVPGYVRATVDLRNPDDAAMRRAEEHITAFYERVGAEERVRVGWRQTARTPYVAFDDTVRARIAECAQARGLGHEALVSGAGHDAQELSRICPAGMIFVPGEHDGISHNPREYSTAAQCQSGIDVLLDVALSFADEGPA